jgi:hypothetical protein
LAQELKAHWRVSGNQYLHRKSHAYRNAVRGKLAAYIRHIQLGLIAQGLLQILSATTPKLVWKSSGSCGARVECALIGTVRPALALSEQVVAVALRKGAFKFSRQYPPGISRNCRQSSILWLKS